MFLVRICLESQVPIFVERFILTILAAIVTLLVIMNPLNLGWDQRVALFIAVTASAYLVATAVHRTNSVKPSEPSPAIQQHSEGPNSPNIVAGPNARISIRTGPFDHDLAIDSLAVNLRQFGRTLGRVETGEAGGEFASQLRKAFLQAGWQTNSGDVIMDSERFAFKGVKVVIQTRPLSLADHAPAAAVALSRELLRQGFNVINMTDDEYGAPGTENFVRVLVGSR